MTQVDRFHISNISTFLREWAICDYCGVAFPRCPAHNARYRMNFCSRECYANWRKLTSALMLHTQEFNFDLSPFWRSRGA